MLAAATAYVMGAVRGTPPTTTAGAPAATAVPQSYEISPYRSVTSGSHILTPPPPPTSPCARPSPLPRPAPPHNPRMRLSHMALQQS